MTKDSSIQSKCFAEWIDMFDVDILLVIVAMYANIDGWVDATGTTTTTTTSMYMLSCY